MKPVPTSDTTSDVPAAVPGGSVSNVQVNVGMPAIHFAPSQRGHPFIVRALWWLFVGWWLSAIFIVLGYVLVGTLLFLPVGLWFLHRVPQAQTLRSRTIDFTTEFRNNAIVFTEARRKQVAWYWRLLYLPLGLVLELVWLPLAWLVGYTIIGLPLSIWMLDRAPAVLTLQRH